MFGLFMLIVWFVAACAYGVKATRYNIDSKNKALKNGSDSYIDSNHFSRDIDDDAMYYYHTDLNGDAWKIYPHHEKPNKNMTQAHIHNLRKRRKQESEEYVKQNLNRAENEGWRFYRIKKGNELLKNKPQRYYDITEIFKGYEYDGPDIYIDRENGHECIFITDYSAYCIYDLTDGKLYDWYFKTYSDFDRVWERGDEEFFLKTAYYIKKGGADYAKKNCKKLYTDVIYKCGEQAEYHFTEAEINKYFKERGLRDGWQA